MIHLPASLLTEKGARRIEALSDRAAAALHTGSGRSTNPKLWPCEDSVALVPLDDGCLLAGVADAHFGGRIGETLLAPLAETWAQTEGEVGARLQQTLLRLEASALAIREKEDDSETTLILAHVAPTRVEWVSVGDSLLIVAEEDVAARKNQLSGFFMGAIPLARMGHPALAGRSNLRAGQVVLLATDGLEPEYSGLDLSAVATRITGEGPAVERLEALVNDAANPERGGGRDNLGLVLIQV